MLDQGGELSSDGATAQTKSPTPAGAIELVPALLIARRFLQDLVAELFPPPVGVHILHVGDEPHAVSGQRPAFRVDNLAAVTSRRVKRQVNIGRGIVRSNVADGREMFFAIGRQHVDVFESAAHGEPAIRKEFGLALRLDVQRRRGRQRAGCPSEHQLAGDLPISSPRPVNGDRDRRIGHRCDFPFIRPVARVETEVVSPEADPECGRSVCTRRAALLAQNGPALATSAARIGPLDILEFPAADNDTRPRLRLRPARDANRQRDGSVRVERDRNLLGRVGLQRDVDPRIRDPLRI